MCQVVNIQDLALLKREDVVFFEQVSKDLSMFDRYNIRFAHHTLENGTIVQRKMYNKGCAIYKVSDIDGSTRYYDTPNNIILVMRLFKSSNSMQDKIAKVLFAKNNWIQMQGITIVSESNEESWSKIPYDFPEMFDPRGSKDINKVKDFWYKATISVVLSMIQELNWMNELPVYYTESKLISYNKETYEVTFKNLQTKECAVVKYLFRYQVAEYVMNIARCSFRVDDVKSMQKKHEYFAKLIKEIAYFEIVEAVSEKEGFKKIPFNISDWVNLETNPITIYELYNTELMQTRYQLKS